MEKRTARLQERQRVPQECPYCGHEHPLRFLRRDPLIGVACLKKLAASGHADALFCLACRYRDGEDEGTPQDSKLAAVLLGRAVELGYTDACIRLADMLLGVGLSGDEDTGIAVDAPRGLSLMRRAAEEGGHALAQFNMGFILSRGLHGVTRDDAKAARWWKLASDGGSFLAAMNLADVHLDGEGGLPRSELHAFKYATFAPQPHNKPRPAPIPRLGQLCNCSWQVHSARC